MAKPNILLLMTDQQRWDAMGCSGNWVETPNMDRLAREGVRFTNCVTNSPVCVPTRLSLATGLYPHNTGVWDNLHYNISEEVPTWMQAVRRAGYRTSLFGKTHLHEHRGDLRDREELLRELGLDDINEIGGPRASAWVGSHMTDYWESLGLWADYKADYRDRYANAPHEARPSVLPLEAYADVYVGQQAKSYLRDYEREEPWFCWVSFGGPHEPWDTPEPYAGRYDPRSMPTAVPRPEDRSEGPRGGLNARLTEPSQLSSEAIAAMRADYAGNVTLIDDQIGEILEVLEARGDLENTVIVFCSDHGELNGDYGLIYKQTFLNGAVRVPLIIRTPDTLKMGAGSVSDAMVEWFDIGPTLVDLAGGSIDYPQFAQSLVPVMENSGQEHRDYAVSEFGGEVMYLDRQWKMVLNREGLPYLLFDVEEDPDEVNNRVSDPATREQQVAMRLRIQEFLVRNQLEFSRERPPHAIVRPGNEG